MAGITQAQAEAKLALWMAADEAVATGQEYSIGPRRLVRADAKLIRDNILFWEKVVSRMDRGGIRVRGAVPL